MLSAIWFLSDEVRMLRACERGDIKVVERYLDQGVSPSTRWKNSNSAYCHDYSALMWATRFGQLAIVQLLIERGADYLYSMEWDGNVLHVAAFHGQTAIGSFLLSRGMDIESRRARTLYTPLHVAAGQLRYDFVEMLILHGANVNTLDFVDCTPLDKASLYQDQRTAELIKKHGGNFGRFDPERQ